MWFIDSIRRHREERFLKDLMATKGAVEFVADRRARQILREMRFDIKTRLYFRWMAAMAKWAFNKILKKEVLKTPKELVEAEQEREQE